MERGVGPRSFDGVGFAKKGERISNDEGWVLKGKTEEGGTAQSTVLLWWVCGL